MLIVSVWAGVNEYWLDPATGVHVTVAPGVTVVAVKDADCAAKFARAAAAVIAFVPPLPIGRVPETCVVNPILPNDGAVVTPPEIRALPVATSATLPIVDADAAINTSPVACDAIPKFEPSVARSVFEVVGKV